MGSSRSRRFPDCGLAPIGSLQLALLREQHKPRTTITRSMSDDCWLPEGLVHVRTTDLLDQDHHPSGILRAHRVAEGVWARLVVRSGSLGFVFEDRPGDRVRVTADSPMVIPPTRLHHVEFDGPVSFVLEFHRGAGATAPVGGEESTGLVDDGSSS